MHALITRIETFARRHPLLALDRYQRVYAAAKAQDLPDVMLQALYGRFFILERLGRAQECADALYAGLGLAEQRQLTREAAYMQLALGRLLYTRGEYRDAIESWSRCLDTGVLCGEAYTGIEARIGLGQIYYTVGEHEQGAHFLQDAWHLLESYDDELRKHYLKSKLALNIGVNLLSEPVEAEAYFRVGLDAAQQGKIREYEAEAYWHLAHLQLEAGDRVNAEALCQTAMALALACDYLWLTSAAARTMGSILEAEGRVDDAIAVYLKALQFCEANGLRHAEAQYSLKLSQHAETKGQFDKALQYARQFESVSEALHQSSIQNITQNLSQYALTRKAPSEQLLDLSCVPAIDLANDDAFEYLCHASADILGVDWITLWLVDGDSLVCQSGIATRLPGDEAAKAVFSRYLAPLQHLRDPLVVHDARLHPMAQAFSAIAEWSALRSVLDVPLRMGNQIIGVFCLGQIAQQRYWQREDVLFASHLAKLIERVYSNQQKRRSEAQIVSLNAELQKNNALLEERVKSRTEQLEIAKDAAEAASKAKGSFLANMSHELRTPMNAVLGMAQLLERTALDAEQRKYVGMIRGAGSALLHIINDILDFSKIEAGRLEIEAAPFELAKIVDALASVMSATARDKDIDLLIAVHPATPRFLIGDSLRIEQILLNLLSNALKFTASGRVAVWIDPISTADGQTNLAFRIRDTGIGLDEEQQKRLFSAFVQADVSITRKFGGTGLGLAITKQLTHLMGGKIEVNSEVGVGTEFTVTLPFTIATSDQSARTLPKICNIAVFDAWTESAKAIKAQMESWHCKALLTPSHLQPEELVDFIEEYIVDRSDMLLIDWASIAVDGLAILRRIRQLASWADKPIVLMATPFYHQKLAAKDFSELDVQLLLKPVTASSLIDVIAERLSPGGRQAAQPAQGLGTELAKLRILLVEDNELNQIVAKGLLEQAGANVDIAGNGQIAVDKLTTRDHRYDVVLMDVHMPVMDGKTATRIIRQQLQDTVPIIFMTAAVMNDERVAYREVGMSDLVAKPIDGAELIATILRQCQALAAEVIPLAESAPPPALSIHHFQPEKVKKLLWIGGELNLHLIASLRNTVNSAQKNIQLVPALFASGDYPQAGTILHTVKGSVGMVADRAFFEFVELVEHSVKSGDAKAIDTDLPLLQEKLTDIATALETWVSEQTAAR